MSKGRIIVSTTTDNVDKHAAVRQHAALLGRQVLKFPFNTLRHAIGMFEGKEELSVVIDIPDVPFITLAASAYAMCIDNKQKSVYFSHNGNAFSATTDGEMVKLGREHESLMPIPEPWGITNHTRIIGTDYYIWTDNK